MHVLVSEFTYRKSMHSVSEWSSKQMFVVKDINECQINNHDCLDTQRCDNTIGSYTCIRLRSCGTGYTLNAETTLCEGIYCWTSYFGYSLKRVYCAWRFFSPTNNTFLMHKLSTHYFMSMNANFAIESKKNKHFTICRFFSQVQEEISVINQFINNWNVV